MAPLALLFAVPCLNLSLRCTAVSPMRVLPVLEKSFHRLIPSADVDASAEITRIFDDFYTMRMRLTHYFYTTHPVQKQCYGSSK